MQTTVFFCNLLAQNAVHAAMAGRTGFVVGYWNSQFTTLPIEVAVDTRKRISTEGELWSNVLETTGQPKQIKNTTPTKVVSQKDLK
jgi:6-phosphofructokinase 1